MKPLVKGNVALLAALAVTACGGSGTGPSGTGRVVLQLSTTAPGASGSAPMLAGATITKGSDVLVISQVQLVARKLKLERVDGTCPAPVLSASESGGEDSDAAETPECPNLRLGPLLLAPPVTDGAQTAFDVTLPVGTYKELKLQIHKPTSKPDDLAFVAANPGFAGISIKVNGTFNGTAFSFTTDITSEVEVEFDAPVVVAAAGTTSITLGMDVRAWFLAEGGAALVSPLALTQQSRQRVEQNIRSSFHAFEDEDHDGKHD